MSITSKTNSSVAWLVPTRICAAFALTVSVNLVPFAAAAHSDPASTSGQAAVKPQSSRPPKGADAKPANKPAEKIVTVTVRPNSEIAGTTFTLGEIADIQGDDTVLIAQLSSIEIGAAPLPGLPRIFNPGDILVRLRQHHLEVPRVQVTLPPGMRITRSGQDIATDAVTAAAIASAKDAIKGQPDATLEVVNDGGKRTVAIGKTQILAGAWRGNPEIGALTVPVSILVDGVQVQTVDVALRVHRKMMALVATHIIQLHDIIGPQDVAIMSIDVPAVPDSVLTSINESIGKRATRRIAAMTPVAVDMLEKAPLISANDSVTIVLVYGSLRVTAAGTARQTGAEGDKIHVFATDTKKELEGIVIDKHTVRVEDEGNQ